MMKQSTLFFFVILMIFTSCGSAVDTKDEVTQETPEQGSIIKVDEAGYQFSLSWPESLAKQGVQPEIKYNETSGILEINAGKSIRIECTDEALSLDDIKKELEGSQMFSYNFEDVSKDGFIFQAVLPNGTAYFYNFLQQASVGKKTFLFKNRDNQEFTLRDIKLMKSIAASAQ